MTEVTNKLNIDPSLLTHLVQITEQMKLDIQQVNSRMNVLEQKVSFTVATRVASLQFFLKIYVARSLTNRCFVPNSITSLSSS